MPSQGSPGAPPKYLALAWKIAVGKKQAPLVISVAHSPAIESVLLIGLRGIIKPFIEELMKTIREHLRMRGQKNAPYEAPILGRAG
ncbi:hypothetical protein L202_07335 [Cryptococcus amylolentus CBS 6039]|uniref:Uncharacterized protein n=1 Tax=Cryptococcus amylolentus CBS 6039 TaxID=1295533 RepID=A0A1E3HBU8_9TREE|nr:hypothetical protein L202_07335 [Cryptococcus amylolentus CBS 6039]ODN73807.1 hypothetical protein L202_07335 [Cryptococcus amylolentus CBS 6039]